MFVAMLVGLALGEAVEFHGIFLIPSNQPDPKLALFLVTLVSIAQFAPVYARPKPVGSFRSDRTKCAGRLARSEAARFQITPHGGARAPGVSCKRPLSRWPA